MLLELSSIFVRRELLLCCFICACDILSATIPEPAQYTIPFDNVIPDSNTNKNDEVLNKLTADVDHVDFANVVQQVTPNEDDDNEVTHDNIQRDLDDEDSYGIKDDLYISDKIPEYSTAGKKKGLEKNVSAFQNTYNGVRLPTFHINKNFGTQEFISREEWNHFDMKFGTGINDDLNRKLFLFDNKIGNPNELFIDRKNYDKSHFLFSKDPHPQEFKPNFSKEKLYKK